MTVDPRLITLLLNTFLVSLYFTLGTVYLIGVGYTRKDSNDEGRTVLLALTGLWFVLMTNGIIRVALIVGSILGDGMADLGMTLDIITSALMVPIVLYFVYATMKRNIIPPKIG